MSTLALQLQVIVITGMKEDVQALDSSRLQLVEKLNQVDSELVGATARHNAELQEMWRAENQVAEMRAVNETLRSTKGHIYR